MLSYRENRQLDNQRENKQTETISVCADAHVPSIIAIRQQRKKKCREKATGCFMTIKTQRSFSRAENDLIRQNSKLRQLGLPN